MRGGDPPPPTISTPASRTAFSFCILLPWHPLLCWHWNAIISSTALRGATRSCSQCVSQILGFAYQGHRSVLQCVSPRIPKMFLAYHCASVRRRVSVCRMIGFGQTSCALVFPTRVPGFVLPPFVGAFPCSSQDSFPNVQRVSVFATQMCRVYPCVSPRFSGADLWVLPCTRADSLVQQRCGGGGGGANGTSRHIQHSPNTPTTGLRERGNDTSRSTGRSG